MPKRTSPRWLIAVLALILLALLAVGGWFYHEQQQQFRQDVEEELQAIAQLKVDQIAAWRAERLGDAATLIENPFFVDAVTRLLIDPQAEQSGEILNWFRSLQEHYDYQDILLVDAEGRIHLSLSGSLELSPSTLERIPNVIRDRQPVLTDLHAGPGNLPPRIGVIAPVYARSVQDAEPLGVVILQSDASRFLYPLIESWPMPSRSAETLLVQRDGDAVLYLNELRHQSGTALQLRIPLSETDVSAVMAVTGTEGVVYGRDYRGTDVMAVIRPIPDSSWFMVAKVDEGEAFAIWRTRSVLILAAIMGLVAGVMTAGGIVWQRNRKAYYQALFQAERARQESEARYQTTLMSIGDGVIITNAEGCVELLNPVAEMLTGWSQQDARGKPLEEVFHIINENTRQLVETPASQVMREGIVVGLANHTLLISRDGRQIPIADSGAPIFDTDGSLTGIVLVFRDQTEERAAQKALEDSEAYVRTILDNLPIGIAVNSVEPTVTFTYINDNFPRYYRTTREALSHPDAFWDAAYEDPEFREVIKQRVLADTASGDPERMRWDDVPITRQGEPTTYISARNIPIPDKQMVVSTVWETTERKRAENALRESEESFRLLFESNPHPMWVYDLATLAFLEVNDAAVAHYGYSRDEFLSMRLPDIRPPEDVERLTGDVQLERPALQHSGEWRHRLKNGQIIDVEITSHTLEFAGRQAVLVIAQDITERKRAQAAEREQRALAEALAQTANALISAMDLDDVMNAILDNVARVVPHGAVNIMLIEDDRARPVYLRGYPSDLDDIVREFSLSVTETQNLHEMRVTGKPFLIPNTDEHASWITQPASEGTKSYVAAPIRSRGQVIGFLNVDSGIPGFFTETHAQRLQAFADQASIAIEHAQLYDEIRRHADDLERHVAERTAELNHAKERIEAILNSSSDVIILCRADGRIEQVNPAFDATFHCEHDEAFNQPLAGLIVPDHRETLENAFAAVIESRQPERLEITVDCLHRVRFDADMVLSPIVEQHDRLLGVVCSLRDITQRKRAEEQLRQMLEREMELGELKSRFVSMAAHDLRNPLTVIQTSVSLIESYADKLTDEQKRSKFGTIHHSIDVMVELLDDILTIGRVEAGRVQFNPEPVDLVALYDTIVAEQKQAAGYTHPITVARGSMPDRVYADPKLLRYILVNLLSNAIKYSPEGAPVTVNIACDENDIRLTVQDQGIGIPEADRAHLFEAFYRAENVGNTPGTGLGLAIVKQSVELHGGAITCESEEGAGTTFTVVLPQSPIT